MDHTELLPLREFQEEAIQYGLEGHTLTWLPPGTGKTRIALEIGGRLRTSIPQPMLVITLKPLRMQWVRQAQLWRPDDSISMIIDRDTRLRALEGVQNQWGDEKQLICIVHYDIVSRMQWLKKPPWKGGFWGTVACDESFAIQNRKAARTKHIWAIPSRRRIAATATPWSVSTTQLWGQLHWLYPARYKSYHAWEKRYHEVQPMPWFHPDARKVLPGTPEQLKALWEDIAGFTYRRTEAQVLNELPELVETYVPVPLTASQDALYERIAKSSDIVVELDDFEKEDLESLKEAKGFLPEEIVNGVRVDGMGAGLILPNALSVMSVLMRVTSSGPAKLEWLDAWVEANEGATAIVFTLFKSTARKIAEHFGARLVTSETAPLMPDERHQMIVGTLAKASTGLDLPWVDNAIFVDTAWSRIHNVQGRGRIRRLSSEMGKIKNVYTLEAVRAGGDRFTIDHRLIKAFTEQMSLIELLNDVQAAWQHGEL